MKDSNTNETLFRDLASAILKIENQSHSKLLNFNQALEYLNIKESMLRKLVFEQRIPVTRIGKHLMFNRAKIEEWLEENSKEAK